jgi:hypothetical protein
MRGRVSPCTSRSFAFLEVGIPFQLIEVRIAVLADIGLEILIA